ncbi:hypothetical protein MMC16_005406 [Acarospora aff. strigata]|nr:hypothetical protein [Acarospora aff. strigata]
MALKKTLLKSTSTLIRVLELLISLFILGTFSYYIGVSRKHSFYIPNYVRAIEGIAGAAVLYTLFAVVLTVFLGAKKIFAMLGVLLDLLFCGAFIAVAVLARDGARRCRGVVNTPLGRGDVSTVGIGGVPVKRICRLQQAVFALAIINAILFLITAILQFLLGKQDKNEKRYSNDYHTNDYPTGEARGPFWKRGNTTSTRDTDAELGTVGTAGLVTEKHHNHNNTTNHTTPAIRPSHETGMTGSTMTSPDMGGYAIANKKHTEPTVPVIYDPAPTAPVHRPGYPHLEPAGHTHAPAAPGTDDGYGGYDRTPHGQTTHTTHTHTNF